MQDLHRYQQIALAIQYLTENAQEQPALEEVAARVNMSKFHFQRQFQAWAGVSPKVFLQHLTLAQAKRSLQAGRATLAAAYDAGLSGNGRLHDLFVKMEGQTPGEFQRQSAGLTIHFATVPTPFGPVVVAETERGICRLSFLAENESPLEWLKQEFPAASFLSGLGPNGKLFQQFCVNWESPNHPILLDLRGTPFQLSVWQALLKIPPGQLLAYSDIARLIDRPQAARAVGTAIGRNPVAVLIPCHRVIRESGALGGYRWGTTRKQIINGWESLAAANQ